jgi:hypothetical protein
MAYNHIYNLQFKGLDQTGTNLYYQVKFEKYETSAHSYDVIELIPAQDSPFILNYRSEKDNIFSPIRASYADIKCFIPTNSPIQPYNFYYNIDEYSLRVSLYETNGTTSTLKWQGFLLPDVIQYEWQDQYYLDLVATDNLAVLKNIKYSRDDYYALYDDTSVQNGLSIKDYVCRLLAKTGSTLDVAILCEFKIEDVLKNLEELLISEYAGVDWKTFEPKDCYFLLTSLVQSLGCILYQSNSNGTWYLVDVNRLAVNNLVLNGNFSDGFNEWDTVAPIEIEYNLGPDGSDCASVYGDSNANFNQTVAGESGTAYQLVFDARSAIPGFPGNLAEPYIIIDGQEFSIGAIPEIWNTYTIDFTPDNDNFNIAFFNYSQDGWLFVDNVSVRTQVSIGKKYDYQGTFEGNFDLSLYSKIGQDQDIIWSDRNQLVSLNKRLTGVKFTYPYYERNLVSNFGFFKDYPDSPTIPTDWYREGAFSIANSVSPNTPFDDRILGIVEKSQFISPRVLNEYVYTQMLLINNPPDFPDIFANKIECSVFFNNNHYRLDSIDIAFAKSQTPNPIANNTQYLNYDGNWTPYLVSPIWNSATRIPIIMEEKNQWMKFKCYSKFQQKTLNSLNWNWGTLIIRPQVCSLGVSEITYFDNFKVSIIPQKYQYTKNFVYNSTNVVNSSALTKPFSNILKIDNCQFHSGIAGSYQSQVIEDFIGFIPEDDVYIFSSDKWLRSWETYNAENNQGRTLEECVTRSILSFYQTTWQKFTGNVYGKAISFGQIFNINLASGLYFMHEARFDYVSNRTNITLHQSQTDETEVDFRSWAITEDDMGAGQGEPGSTTSKIQDVESLINPPGE